MIIWPLTHRLFILFKPASGSAAIVAPGHFAGYIPRDFGHTQGKDHTHKTLPRVAKPLWVALHVSRQENKFGFVIIRPHCCACGAGGQYLDSECSALRPVNQAATSVSLLSGPSPISDRHSGCGSAGSTVGSSAAAGNSSGGGGGGGGSSGDGNSMRVYLSQIREWLVEVSADTLFITIRTDIAWYRLSRCHLPPLPPPPTLPRNQPLQECALFPFISKPLVIHIASRQQPLEPPAAIAVQSMNSHS